MKRPSFSIQTEILKFIKNNQGITISGLERKIGTNPKSLREHCSHLEAFGLIRIEKGTKKLSLTKQGLSALSQL